MKYVMGVLVQQTVIILLLFSIADVLPGTERVSLNGDLITIYIKFHPHLQQFRIILAVHYCCEET